MDLNNSVALLDADSMIYRAGFACEKKLYDVTQNGKLLGVASRMKDANAIAEAVGFVDVEISHSHHIESVENALHNLRSIIDKTMERFACPWEVYLSGKGNFRYEVATLVPYKSNRLIQAKPVHYAALRAYLHRKYSARFVDGMEADDEIATRAEEIRSTGMNPIVVTIDKDLRQIGGYNYNWVKGELEDIPHKEAKRFFYQQMLTGDRTDAIPGIPGVGDVTAGKMLAKCNTDWEMYQVVLKAYEQHYMSETSKVITEIGTLLHLQRTREFQPWSPPSPSSQST